jgi:hypothetical protein
MKSDLSKVKVGDKIWTIQNGWTKVVNVNTDSFPIQTEGSCFTIDGKRWKNDKYPTAFLEYPFKEQEIEKDTLVWFRDDEDENWMVGYYSHFEDGQHFVFDYSKKSTETDFTTSWNIVTTENPLS